MKTDITIIGAGVVGLAIAAEISKTNKEIVLLEQHESFGRETSSRSSEVIHAGIYYPPETLKARLCVEGNRLLYEFCNLHGIPHKKTGKLIVAVNDTEEEMVHTLIERGTANGVPGLRLSTDKELAAYDQKLNCVAALFSPSTGIVDSHALMSILERQANEQEVMIAYGTKVTNLTKSDQGFAVTFCDADGSTEELESRIVFNCAGLSSDIIAEMIGIDIDEAGYRMHFSKAEFFHVSDKATVPDDVLVYRARTSGEGLGVHTVVDLQKQVKLGPVHHPTDRTISYEVDTSFIEKAFLDCKQFLPLLKKEDMVPDMSGITPRLGADYVIADEKEQNLPGLINLIGMDSPALTSCLSIAKHVAAMI